MRFHQNTVLSACALLGWILLTFCAPTVSVFFVDAADEFYRSLHRPAWAPPGWLFGPVWTGLYLSMAVGAWLVWRRGGWAEQRRPLAFYLIQLALNAAWTPLFFGLRNPGLALVEIVVLLAAIVVTLRAFWRARRPAGALLIPYLAWVSFATALNFSIWHLNRT